ncbi:MAG: hypothetical protein QM706_14915 [Nitrospira sp.]
MKNLLFALVILFALPLFTIAQNQKSIPQQVTEANNLLQQKQVRHSVMLFRKLHAQMKPADTLYNDVSKGLFESLFYGAEERKQESDWESLLNLSDEALQVLEGDKDHLPADFQIKQYWLYENIIMAYTGMKKYVPAKAYQVQLYKAYDDKGLPKGLDKSYNFERFNNGKVNLYGYEYYVPTGDGKSPASKQIYEVYSRDSLGKDVKLLYTLETIEAEKKDKSPDYVFAKRTTNDKKKVITEIGTVTFFEPVSLEKLHTAVMQYLKGELILKPLEGKK